MCGILGAISPTFSVDHFEGALRLLNHRGPDNIQVQRFSESQWSCYLGHTRLSILDLSSQANQPFTSKSGLYSIVYNGEVYNYQQLKNELHENHQVTFRTNCDTELIVEAFEIWGPACFERFNGMFSLAIYDSKAGSVTLARDRIGIKPLYYCQEGDQFIFASEMKAILQLLDDKELDEEAIGLFLHLGYIPEPNTIFRKISKFPSGSYAVFSGGSLNVASFWNAEAHFKESGFKGNAKKELDRLLNESIESRLIADVPLGSFLSGGIDSSVVSAIASKHSSTALKTFTVGFENQDFDETVFAQKVASHLGSDHTSVKLSEAEAIEKVAGLLEVFDEPFADSSAIPTMLISELASKEVKVCLSGDGGDELFMGYGMYRWASRLSNPLIRALQAPIHSLLSSSANSRNRRAGWLFAPDGGHRESHIFSQEQYLFSRSELQRLLKSNKLESSVPIYSQFAHRSKAENQAFFDFNYYLKDDLLTKVDRSSMNYSLEVRVPLLDHNIAEFALSLDEKFKRRGNHTKVLLKEVLGDYIPKSYFDRPKRGFSVPLHEWLRKDLKYLVDDFLSEDTVRECGVANEEEVSSLKKAFFEQGDLIQYNKIWALTLLHKWLKEHRQE